MSIEQLLFPPVEPYASGMLAVDEIHSIYWEQCGNPHGIPVLFLHGGPGAGASPKHRQFFDPTFYRSIILDQRGAGRSRPLAELKNNTPQHLIADLEKLRHYLQIDKWLVFGGSWGSTLALAYGEAYPEHCLGFVLRGIFLMREQEINWFMSGTRNFQPHIWQKFCDYIAPEEQHDLLHAYYKRLTNPDPAIHMPAARAFSGYEGAISTLLPNPELVHGYLNDTVALGLARIEAHYFQPAQRSILGAHLLKNIDRINHLPGIIVQGQYDLCCPPVTAYELAHAWPKAEFIIVPDAGHSAFEPSILAELMTAMEKFKTHKNST